MLISPAKTLDYDAAPVTQFYTQPRYLEDSAELIKQLQQLSAQDIASLMSLSDKLAGLNMARFQSWAPPFDMENAKQAVLAFRGDVYTGLDADTMTEADFEFAQQHLRILSGLYGVLRPLDLMQAYRLEMGTKFSNSRGKDLYAFWGAKLRESIEAEPALEDGVLINLASNEYFKATQAKKLSARVITPQFKDWKNGQYKMISFYAKKARGLMARFIIDNRIDKVDELKSFDREGYQYSAELSDGDNWVFTREAQ
jgi:cytoplasmic iron level regulating protein YaaA (DUF328/UPF0246 family)